VLRKLPKLSATSAKYAISDGYHAFLKHIRDRLQETNLLVISADITLIYRFINHARQMRMTSAHYSYIIVNTVIS
jgi:hypothetical protein